MQKSMSLKHEPSSEPLHISQAQSAAKELGGPKRLFALAAPLAALQVLNPKLTPLSITLNLKP